jgi:hypothetical protein
MSFSSYRRIPFSEVLAGRNGLNTLVSLPDGRYAVAQGHSVTSVGVYDSNIFDTLEAARTDWNRREAEINCYFARYGTALE